MVFATTGHRQAGVANLCVFFKWLLLFRFAAPPIVLAHIFCFSSIVLIASCGHGPSEPAPVDRDNGDGDSVVTTLSLDHGDLADDFCVSISNDTDRLITVKLLINDEGPYSCSGDILDAIRLINTQHGSEPIYRTVWRFTQDRFRHSVPLTRYRWQHRPEYFFNSVGFGYCDDIASINYHLWSELGFNTRVWALEGHVVSEVLANGRWELYDSDSRVYYLNDDRAICGVTELSNSPSLISAPIDPILPANSWCYSDYLAQVYGTKENNRIGDWYMADSGIYDLKFVFPPGGQFRFPLPLASPLHLSDGSVTSNGAANAELTIPAGWIGTVDVALFVQEILGAPDDIVTIAGNRYRLSSPYLADLLTRGALVDGSAIRNIELSATREAVKVRYLVNEDIFAILPVTRLQLVGPGAENLHCELLERRN